MKKRRWIGVGLLAAMGAGSAVAFGGASFRGTVRDGAQDYSDQAFAPLEAVAAKLATGDPNDPDLMKSYMAAMEGIMCPNGPMAGVRVGLRFGGETLAERETTTDANGLFYFLNLEPGEYGLTIYQPGKEGQEPEAYAWRLKVKDDYGQTGADLMLPEKSIRAMGRVADSAGQSLAGIRIHAFEYRYNGELGRWSSVAHEVEAATDEQGRFELPGLRPMLFWPFDGGPAGYMLKVEGEGFVPCARKVDVVTPETQAALKKWAQLMFGESPKPGQKDWRKFPWPVPANEQGVLEGVDFTLLRPASLGGDVRNAAGAPVTNASVWMRYLDAPPYQPMPFSLDPGSAKTDGDGRFFITGLSTGRYQAVVAVDGRRLEYREVPIELREGEVRTNLELRYEVPATGRIEATVFEKGSAKPIGVYTAYVERVVGTPDSGIASGWLVKDANRPGFFAVDNVSPGTAQFRISAPGYVSQKVDCGVESGATAILPIEMEPAGSALVRVICNGVTTRPCQLLAFREGDTNAIWGWSQRTNHDGCCEIHELPPGLNRLRAQTFGKNQSRYALVSAQIETGQTNAVELETEGPCSFDLDLSFPTNAVVRAWVEPADAPETETFDSKVDMKVHLWAYGTDRIAVTNLPAGEYRIGVQKLESIQSRDRVPMKADQTKTIRLEEGQRPAVAFAW